MLLPQLVQFGQQRRRQLAKLQVQALQLTGDLAATKPVADRDVSSSTAAAPMHVEMHHTASTITLHACGIVSQYILVIESG